MKRKAKKKVVANKDEIAESWCFVCKDGGDLRICDRRECIKSFHPCCVGKDNALLDSDSYWACAWHGCFHCGKSSYLRCFTCTNAVCYRCLPAEDILQVKGKYGFCNSCLKLALLIEENKEEDSDGEKVDFSDLTTFEGLFMDYYYIIKKQEGFESSDIHAAEEKLKIKKGRQYASDSEEYEEEAEEEDQVSDYDGTEYGKKRKRMCKKNRCERDKSAIQTPIKSSKIEFIGWASRPLIEFLTSIGKSTKEKLSQHDVTSIINEYVKKNKLSHPQRRKMISCDAPLQSLLRRRTISRYKLYELLEAHFAENYDESEEDELGCDSEEENSGILNECKMRRKLDSGSKSPKMELNDNLSQSCFASIVVENIKLVYLKRSLLLELLKQPKKFEEKVIGCFVRVKSDPYDYRSRNSYQLMQVEGVETVFDGEKKLEVVFLFSTMPKEISINLLSDGDFSEEECDDLRQRMVSGQLKRPTVEDLQQKAKILHEDLTKHWINKQLALLQNLIDRANEKGWRRDGFKLFEYLERRKRLQTPSEQSKLLGNVPTVIPDANEPLNSNSADVINNINRDKGSPLSILKCNSDVPCDGWQNDKALDEKAQRDHVPPTAEELLVFEGSVSIEPKCDHKLEGIELKYKRRASKIELPSDDKLERWCIQDPNGDLVAK